MGKEDRKRQNTEYRIQNTEYRIQNTEYRIQNTEYELRTQKSERRTADGERFLQARARQRVRSKAVCRAPTPRTPNPELQTPNSKPDGDRKIPNALDKLLFWI